MKPAPASPSSIDALALAVGERGDAQAIRAGASRLEVLATFEPGTDSAASRWLTDNELADDGDGCLLRRVIGTDGRSKAWINGRPVPVQTLRELGATLVDICGQQDYQSLRHRAAQREVLDDLAGSRRPPRPGSRGPCRLAGGGSRRWSN